MAIEIKSMSFGELFDRGIRIFFEYFKNLYLLILILVGPLHFTLLALQHKLTRVSAAEQPELSDMLNLLAITLPLTLVSWLLIAFSNGLIARAIMDEVQEGAMSLSGVFRKVLRLFVPLLLTLLLMAVTIFGISGGLYLAGILCLLLGPVGVLPAVPLLLTAVFFGIYFYLVLALTPYAVVLEGLAYFKAMGRSRSLIKGNVGKYFLIALLLGIASMIFSFIFGEMPEWIGVPENWQTLGWGISAVLQMVFNVYTAIVVTLFYIDLKVRKEGFDLAVLSGRDRKDGESSHSG